MPAHSGMTPTAHRITVSVLLLVLTPLWGCSREEGTTIAIPAKSDLCPENDGSDRVALVIGIDRYDHNSPLSNARSDAALIGKKLCEMKYAVRYESDLTRAQLVRVLDEFGEMAEDTITSVIYYAGHAIQIPDSEGRNNYLIPTDGKLSSYKDTGYLLPLSAMEYAASFSEWGVVFLDACRDNPLLRQALPAESRGPLSMGAALADSSEGNVITVYATNTGNVATDEGAFAHALAANIDKPKDIRLLLGDVTEQVYRMTDNQQRPGYRADVMGGQELLLVHVSENLNPVNGRTKIAQNGSLPIDISESMLRSGRFTDVTVIDGILTPFVVDYENSYQKIPAEIDEADWWHGSEECEWTEDYGYNGISIEIRSALVQDFTGDGIENALVEFRFHPCGGNHGSSRTCIIHGTEKPKEYLADCIAGGIEVREAGTGIIRYVKGRQCDGPLGGCVESHVEECSIYFSPTGVRSEPVCNTVDGESRRVTKIYFEPEDAKINLNWNAEILHQAPGFIEFEVNDSDFSETTISKPGYITKSFEGEDYPDASYRVNLEQSLLRPFFLANSEDHVGAVFEMQGQISSSNGYQARISIDSLIVGQIHKDFYINFFWFGICKPDSTSRIDRQYPDNERRYHPRVFSITNLGEPIGKNELNVKNAEVDLYLPENDPLLDRHLICVELDIRNRLDPEVSYKSIWGYSRWHQK